MKKRFVIYGATGWIIEVVCTGLWSLFHGDLRLVSRTYLWMFPIYGSAIFMEPIYQKIKSLHWSMRGLIWTVIIFVIEYMSGAALKSFIGVYAWNYTGKPMNIQGIIRLDYAPAWFVMGLLFEKLYILLLKKKIS